MLKNRLKSENGYIDGEVIGGCAVIIFLLAIFIFIVVAIVGNLCFDFASGNHRITPTAVDVDMFGNYKVYYKTSQYTQNSNEDYYYIEKGNNELAEQMKEYIRQGKEVVVYYEQWVGFKGWGAPSTSPITKIELIEE